MQKSGNKKEKKMVPCQKVNIFSEKSHVRYSLKNKKEHNQVMNSILIAMYQLREMIEWYASSTFILCFSGLSCKIKNMAMAPSSQVPNQDSKKKPFQTNFH